MKNKILSCNDTNGLERMLNEFMSNKKIVSISPTIYNNGNYITHLFYYDITLDKPEVVISQR